MQIENGKKRSQNGSKCGFGRVLGSIWEGVGTVWAVFSALFDCFCDALNPFFFKYRSRMGSKMPLASILDRFWKGWGRGLAGFGQVSGMFLVATVVCNVTSN